MTLELDEIKQAVREHLAAELLPGAAPSELGDDRPLVTGGLLDSLAAVRLITFLEERFGVTFEAHEVGVDYLDTVAIIAGVVREKQERG
jgi:acyl carrier protein